MSLLVFALLKVSGIELCFAGEAFKVLEDMNNWSKHGPPRTAQEGSLNWVKLEASSTH